MPHRRWKRAALCAAGVALLLTVQMPLAAAEPLLLADGGKSAYSIVLAEKADPATRHIPIVAVTAHAMAGDEQRARAAGCDGYVAKPLDVVAFQSMVSSMLTG